MNKPAINVTPLIDVLLVLLIIFMVVVPMKPHGFNTKIPSEPDNIKDVKVEPNPKTLIVKVERDGTLTLNEKAAVGSLDQPEPVTSMLQSIFASRIQNGDISDSFADDKERPFRDHIERTVFIKAQGNIPYGSVVKAVDIAKSAGAYPISLQIDNLVK